MPIPASTSAVRTAASHTSMPLGTNLFTGGICRHKDSVSNGKGKYLLLICAGGLNSH